MPEKELRRVITSRTGSDWRARMNIRAEVRRLLRADNVTLKQEPKPKKHLELAKALNLPQEVVPLPDQISALRGEVADLTELMVRVYKGVGTLREAVTAQAPPPPPQPLNSRSVKIKEYLSLADGFRCQRWRVTPGCRPSRSNRSLVTLSGWAK